MVILEIGSEPVLVIEKVKSLFETLLAVLVGETEAEQAVSACEGVTLKAREKRKITMKIRQSFCTSL